MRNRNTIVLILIILLALVILWIDLPIQHIGTKQLLFWQQPVEARSLMIKQGLDLRGGTQILLEASRPRGNRSPLRICRRRRPSSSAGSTGWA